MIIFLYGPDTFRSRQKLGEIIETYKKAHKGGLGLSVFEGENLSFQDLKIRMQSISMFKEKKLVIVKNALGNKKFKEDFLSAKKIFLDGENIVVFFEEGDLPAKDSLAAFLEKNASKSQEFKLLSGAQLKNWIKKEFKKYEAEADLPALEKLVQSVGGDLWQMSNEINKLAGFKRGESIGTKDVELLVHPKIETDIFKTIDCIAQKNKKGAFVLLKKHLDKGDSPLYLFSMINFQFRNLIIVKEKCREGDPDEPGQINSWAKELGIHPFVFRKAFYQSQHFSSEELKKIYQNIFKIDLATKTGELTPEIALDIFVAQL